MQMDAQDPEHIVCCNCGYAINIALDGKREALTHSLSSHVHKNIRKALDVQNHQLDLLTAKRGAA